MSVFVWFTAWNLYPVFKHLFFFFSIFDFSIFDLVWFSVWKPNERLWNELQRRKKSFDYLENQMNLNEAHGHVTPISYISLSVWNDCLFHRVVNAVVVYWLLKNVSVSSFLRWAFWLVILYFGRFNPGAPLLLIFLFVCLFFWTGSFDGQCYVSIFQYFLFGTLPKKNKIKMIIKLNKRSTVWKKNFLKQYQVVLIISLLQWIFSVVICECFSSLLQTPRYDQVLCFSI